jgi:hypothetical protein
VTRWLIGGVGLAAGVYGGWLLLTRQDTAQLLDAGVWLVSGVLLHDLVLSALILLGALAVGLLPRVARTPTVIALVVTGSLTLVALPVLGRFGEREDNPTHLDRPYLASWLALVAVTVGIVVAAAVVRARRREE